MLADCPVRFSIPASDMARARHFYAEMLGQTPFSESSYGLSYRSSGTLYNIVPSEDAGKATYSLMTWLVEDIEDSVRELRQRGVVFEDYDFGFLKTVDNIADFGTDRVAWFKDSEGNLLAIAQPGTA